MKAIAEWRAMPPDDDDATPVTKTAAEWVLKCGPGYLASEDC